MAEVPTTPSASQADADDGHQSGGRSPARAEQQEQRGNSPRLAGEHCVFHCKSQSAKTLCTLLPCMRGDNKEQVRQPGRVQKK